MSRLPITLLVLLTFVFAGCEKPQARWHYPAPSAATRPADIPPPDVLTLATPEDTAEVATAAADPAISEAVTAYLGPGAPRWKIVGLRNVGENVLLWVAFPEVDDGGIDLVYSTPDRRVKWQFKGGERG